MPFNEGIELVAMRFKFKKWCSGKAPRIATIILAPQQRHRRHSHLLKLKVPITQEILGKLLATSQVTSLNALELMGLPPRARRVALPVPRLT
jgi:hypothetical protein